MDVSGRIGYNVFVVQYWITNKYAPPVAIAQNNIWVGRFPGFNGCNNVVSFVDWIDNLVFDGDNNDFVDFGDVQYI